MKRREGTEVYSMDSPLQKFCMAFEHLCGEYARVPLATPPRRPAAKLGEQCPMVPGKQDDDTDHKMRPEIVILGYKRTTKKRLTSICTADASL